MPTESVVLELKSKGARVVSADLESVANSSRKANDAVSLLKRGLAGIGAVIGITAITRISDSFTTLETQLRNVTNSTQQYNKVFNELFDIAQKNGDSFSSLSEAYVKLNFSLSDSVKNSTDLVKVTNLLSKAFAASGTNAQTSAGATLQLTQGLATNFKAAGQELNSIIEGAPLLAKTIAIQLGGNAATDLKIFAEQGRLTAKTFLDALLASENAINAFKIPPTIGRSLERIKNQFLVMVGEFNNATGASKSLSNVLNILADNLGKLIFLTAAASIVIFRNALVNATVASAGFAKSLLLLPFTSLSKFANLLTTGLSSGMLNLTTTGLRLTGVLNAMPFRALDTDGRGFMATIQQTERQVLTLGNTATIAGGAIRTTLVGSLKLLSKAIVLTGFGAIVTAIALITVEIFKNKEAVSNIFSAWKSFADLMTQQISKGINLIISLFSDSKKAIDENKTAMQLIGDAAEFVANALIKIPEFLAVAFLSVKNYVSDIVDDSIFAAKKFVTELKILGLEIKQFFSEPGQAVSNFTLDAGRAQLKLLEKQFGKDNPMTQSVQRMVDEQEKAAGQSDSIYQKQIESLRNQITEESKLLDQRKQNRQSQAFDLVNKTFTVGKIPEAPTTESEKVIKNTQKQIDLNSKLQDALSLVSDELKGTSDQFEVYDQKLQALNLLYKNGKINLEEYNRANKTLNDNLRDNLGFDLSTPFEKYTQSINDATDALNRNIISQQQFNQIKQQQGQSLLNDIGFGEINANPVKEYTTALQNLNQAQQSIGLSSNQMVLAQEQLNLKLLSSLDIKAQESDITALLSQRQQQLNSLQEQGVITQQQASDALITYKENLLGSKVAAEEMLLGVLSINDAANALASGLSSAIAGFVDGTKTAKQAFLEFAQSFLNAISQMILKQIILNALKAAGGGFSQGGQVQGFASGGHVQKFPTGGKVNGPGTSISDSIPARLSNGEFVVRASQAKKNLELLNAINNGLTNQSELRRPANDQIASFRNGGLAGLPRFAQGGTASLPQPSNINMNNTQQSEKQSNNKPSGIKNVIVFDKQQLQSEMLRSDEAEDIIVSVVQQNGDILRGA